MTNEEREEAITYIQEWLKDEYSLTAKDRWTLEMAISALSQPQGDTISRQAAIERIDEYIEEYNYVDADGNHEPKWCAMMEAKMVLEELSPSQPEIEAIRKEIEKQKIMVSGSYLTKDQQSVFRNAINVALAVIDKHIRESKGE